MTDSLWWYRALGEEFGPVDVDVLRQLIHDGTLSCEDRVRHGVDGRWRRADQFTQLYYSQSEGDARSTLSSSDNDSQSIDASWMTLDEIVIEAAGSSAACALPEPGAIEPGELGTSNDEAELPVEVDFTGPTSVPTFAMASGSADESTDAAWAALEDAGPDVSAEVEEVPGPCSAETSGMQSNLLAASEGKSADDVVPSSSAEEDHGTSSFGDNSGDSSVPRASFAMTSAIHQAAQASRKKRENSSRLSVPTPAPIIGQMARSSGGALRDSLSSIPELMAGVAQPFVHLGGRLRDVIILLLIVTLIGAGVAGAMQLWQSWWTSESTYMELAELHREFQELREAGVSSADWSGFAARVNVRTSEIQERLAPTATSEWPGRQALLWVARDYMPAMLKDSREERGESERLCETHLARARRELGLVGQRDRPESAWITAAILAVDGLLLVLGGVWFYRRG